MLMRSSSTPLLVSLQTNSDASCSVISKHVSFSSGSDHFHRVSSDGNLQNLEAVSDHRGSLPSMRKHGAPRPAKYHSVSRNVVNIGGGGGMGGGGRGDDAGSGDDHQYELEMFYKKMVENNPCNALFLSNYAQFLWQVKHDAGSAEYYYSRAILAEPNDGQILSKYGRLIWDIHHDHQRASIYFQQALQAAPEDTHVLASYANFLWETDDEEDIQMSLGIVADSMLC